jgi:glycerol-3-phosphate O-acyltransferase / dihydroxyacetone phosphate acyltransferase
MFFGLSALALPGLIVHLPIAAYAKLRSQQEARKAAANSSVKLEGKDVIASQKIVLSFTLLPLLYTTLFCTLWYYLGLPGALLSMCGVPPISFASLMIVERVVLLGQSLIPLLLWLFPSYRNLLAALFQRRASLQHRVRKLVEELGPHLGNEVWNQRIVANADFEYENQAEPDSSSNTVWPQRQSYASTTSGPSRIDRANPLDMLGTSLDSIQMELEKELDI